jgi:hypothetical protein
VDLGLVLALLQISIMELEFFLILNFTYRLPYVMIITLLKCVEKYLFILKSSITMQIFYVLGQELQELK